MTPTIQQHEVKTAADIMRQHSVTSFQVSKILAERQIGETVMLNPKEPYSHCPFCCERLKRDTTADWLSESTPLERRRYEMVLGTVANIETLNLIGLTQEELSNIPITEDAIIDYETRYFCKKCMKFVSVDDVANFWKGKEQTSKKRRVIDLTQININDPNFWNKI